MSNLFPPALETTGQKIQHWSENSAMLKKLRALEMEQRKWITATIYQNPKKGTNNHDLGSGWQLKYVLSYTSKIDKAALDLLMPEIEKLGERAIAQVQAAVKWEPSLVAKGWKDMDDDVKAIFNECVTTKPDSPTLTLVPPKA